MKSNNNEKIREKQLILERLENELIKEKEILNEKGALIVNFINQQNLLLNEFDSQFQQLSN